MQTPHPLIVIRTALLIKRLVAGVAIASFAFLFAGCATKEVREDYSKLLGNCSSHIELIVRKNNNGDSEYEARCIVATYMSPAARSDGEENISY